MLFVICDHLKQNKEVFQPFLRNGIQSIDMHLSSTRISENSTWATEVEIFAVSHLLKVDIYTYSAGQWLRFSVEDVEPNIRKETGAIYLNHYMENHYNVVVSVSEDTIDIPQTVTKEKQKEFQNEFCKQNESRARRPKTSQTIRKNKSKERAADKRKQSLKRRYQEDSLYREKKLKLAFDRYRDDQDFQAKVKSVSRERYHDNILYQTRKNKTVLESMQ